MFNTVIWLADGLKSKFSCGLKRLYSPSRHDGRSGRISIQRSPVNFGLGVGVPDREYNDVSLTIIERNYNIYCRTFAKGATNNEKNQMKTAAKIGSGAVERTRTSTGCPASTSS
jgi:hypothetical protein